MEISDVITVLSNSLKDANKLLEKSSSGEIGFTATDFSISFPVEFKIENNKTKLNFIDFKSQVNLDISHDVTKTKLKEGSVTDNLQDESRINLATINIRLKPVPIL